MKRFQLLVGCLIWTCLLPFTVSAQAPKDPSPSPVLIQEAQPESDVNAPAMDPLFELDPVEARPSTLVLDEARLFSEREQAQLSARLIDFRTRHKVSVYVAAYSVLIGETIDDRAKRLKDAWLTDGRGIILAYQRGTEKMTFSSTADPKNYVSRTELEQMFANAFQKAAVQGRGSSRVIAAAGQLMADLPASILAQEGSNAMSSSETRWFVIWALVGLTALALGGMFAFHFLRRAQLKVTEAYTFPMIKVPERFGAAYCGGHQAEMEFKARPG